MITSTIQQGDDGDFFIAIPDDIIDELGLKPGDDLLWEIDEPAGGFRQPTVTLRKA